jgi:cell division protein FtsZ
MDCRQLLQTLNAIGASAVLPAASFSEPSASVKTPPLIEPTNTINGAYNGRVFPRIGLVAVGGISRSILCDPTWRLPYLHRTIAINTDADSLLRVKADRKILVRDGKTRPLSLHAAQLFAQSVIPEVVDAVTGLDMVLLVTGMGGVAGTGIAPGVAQVLREQNILTLGFSISPFAFESEQRHQNAQHGIRELGVHVNALLPVYNSDLEQVVDENASLEAVMKHAPLAFIQLCRSITNSVAIKGCHGGIDFEDMRHVILRQTGHCAFGFGSASGVNAAEAAARQAIGHPFLGQGRLKRSTAALVTIEGAPSTLFLRGRKNIMFKVRRHLPPDAHIVCGTVSTAPEDGSDFRVSILVSGIL